LILLRTLIRDDSLSQSIAISFRLCPLDGSSDEQAKPACGFANPPC